MTWNYRVMKFTQRGEDYYELHEVFYRHGGVSWTKDAVALHGDSQSDLRLNLEQQRQAYARPILIVKDDAIVGEEPWEPA